MVGFCSQKWKKCRHELLCLRKKVEMYFVCVCVFVRAVLGFVSVFSLQYYVKSVQEKHEKRSRFSKFNGACWNTSHLQLLSAFSTKKHGISNIYHLLTYSTQNNWVQSPPSLPRREDAMPASILKPSHLGKFDQGLGIKGSISLQ